MEDQPAKVVLISHTLPIHQPAKADYRTDEVRRYMRRHGGHAAFIGIGPELVDMTLDSISSLTCKQIRDQFNAARRGGYNQ